MKKTSLQTKSESLPVALIRETSFIGKSWIRDGAIGIPKQIIKSILFSPKGEKVFNTKRWKEITGSQILDFFNSIGPVYGKIFQISLMKLPENQKQRLFEFGADRILGQWPPLPFETISHLLDKEIPGWREQLKVDPIPLGVASMAQVHSCVDTNGKEWVIKVLKPNSRIRLIETVEIIEQLISQIEQVSNNKSIASFIKDARSMANSLKEEIRFDKEKETLQRIREKLAKKKNNVLEIPQTFDIFCSHQVITMEKFNGIILSDVVNGKVTLNGQQRKKLARNLLSELLVQVFELGLFHGDPHAGNLILLENGNIGLFDWGLAGELSDSDRKHIASLLKAVLTMDGERLIDALHDMAQNSDAEEAPSKDTIKKEIKKLLENMKKMKENGEKMSFVASVEGCLKSANKLGLELPQGLLMMIKSLVTIEGLAKGVDPEVPLKRIASPVLFRAAQPGVRDLLSIAKNLPKIAKKLMD